MNFIDKQIFKFWVWLGDQMFDYGLVMTDENKEPLNVIFTQDKEIISRIIEGQKYE